jgi:hypothetical protein
MTDRDLPVSAQSALQELRTFSLGYYMGQVPTSPPYGKPPYAGFIKRPKREGPLSAITKDDWLFPTDGGGRMVFSNKHIGPLVKSGLVSVDPMAQPNGMFARPISIGCGSQ